MTRKKTSRNTSRRKPRTRKQASKRRPPRLSLTYSQKALLVGLFIIFATAIIVLSLLSPDQGQLTSWLSGLMWQIFGWGAYFVPVITAGVGLYLILLGMEQPPQLPSYRLLGVGLLFLVFMAFASMIVVLQAEGMLDYWQAADLGTGGGYIGGMIASVLTALVGNLGAIFILMVVGLVAAVLVSGISREDMSRYLKHTISRDDGQFEEADVPRPPIRINPDRAAPSEPLQLPLVSEEELQEEPAQPRRRFARKKKQQPVTAKQAQSANATQTSRRRQPGYKWTLPAISEILDSGSDLDLNNVAIREQVEIIEHTLESFGAPATVVEINQGPTVTQFGVEPNYIQMRNGRRTKVKVSKISGLADDLALALAARSIRIQAPVPGKSYVGVEVPNPVKSLVSLRDVMESTEFGRIKSTLGLGLGQNVSGQPIVADLAIMPHMLIAGTTGSGKSVLVNSIISGLLLQNTPTDLKLVMIDPKRVELTGYNGIPHLAAPVVVEMDRVISTLQWALREMDARYKKFADLGTRHIGEYNKKISRRKDAEKMPYVVIIIDELADLMMLAPEDTERSVTRLAQLARATGIHMVIATQRPSVDVVTGLIKANFPARIAFAVASGTDSRVILDSAGAERLLGQGDMLFQKPDAPAPLRLQGCYVSDAELNKLVTYWQRARRSATITPETGDLPAPTPAPRSAPPEAPPAAAAAPTPSQENVAEVQTDAPPPPPEQSTDKRPSPTKKKDKPLQQPLWEALQEEAEKPQYSDELMPEAIALVRKLDKASTSLLQRRFRIGYTRAARMIDAMEEMKIIGPPTGTSKAREVYPPSEDEDKLAAAPSTNSPPEDADQPTTGS
jgi:S-DNA-T family DNA segregation ATPase FtsK/SpoIIIE